MKKSKASACLFSLVLMISLLVPLSSAPASAVVVPNPTYASSILGYGGALIQINNSYWSNIYLRHNGYRQTITVQAQITSGVNPSGSSWNVETAPHGNYRIKASWTDYYVNLNRVFQPNQYWLATSFPYETNLNGVDQRVVIGIILGSYSHLSFLRLAVSATNDSRAWYLMADKSGVSSSSDVIWYTTTSYSRAYWTNPL